MAITVVSRRDFLRRCALLAAGTVAVDQMELLEKLSHSKVFTTGGYEPVRYMRFSQINKRYQLAFDKAAGLSQREWVERQMGHQAAKSAGLILQRVYGL